MERKGMEWNKGNRMAWRGMAWHGMAWKEKEWNKWSGMQL